MNQPRQYLLFNELYGEIEIPKPVNVAAVPHRSPFRYPGGKTWFVPTFRKWIGNMQSKPAILVEPFAGGGIISLTALFENHVQRSVMVEMDDEIASVWQTIVNGEADRLANRVLQFELTEETVIQEIHKDDQAVREKAFRTILKNRTFHGGILAKGSGLLKYGENGRGIRSRWYPNTLAKRLSNLNSISDRIDFIRGDGLEVLDRYSRRDDTVFFIDPPYTAGGKKAGKRLYKFFEIDHARLFEVCASLQGEFLMTYDDSDEVKALAAKHGFDTRLIPMKNTHHAKMEELVIGRNLAWMDFSR